MPVVKSPITAPLLQAKRQEILALAAHHRLMPNSETAPIRWKKDAGSRCVAAVQTVWASPFGDVLFELAELIHNGESSGVEFKRDDILLGVENDRTVSGLTRDPAKTEEWVMEVARVHLRPAAIPYWETIEWSEGRIIGIISLPADGTLHYRHGSSRMMNASSSAFGRKNPWCLKC